MTSGTFASVEPAFIWVDREKRQRKELVNIDELAESIRQNGLIHPPVIKRDGELVVGERRWTAVKQLGWTAIPVQWIDDLDEEELQAVEYEENVKRVDLPWQDKVMAVQRYHEHRLRADPSWTMAATADRLGVSSAFVGEKLSIASELTAGNQLVSAADRYSKAKNIVKRTEARRKASAFDAVETTVTDRPPERIAPILNEDFHEWAASYTGTPFNFIHCDFPYGVNMDNSDQGAGGAYGTYVDSPDVFWALLGTLHSSMENVVAPSAHMIFWFSMDHYQQTLENLRSMGWSVSPFPLIWLKSDNAGIIPDANRQPRRIYETAFFCTRGDRFIKQSVANAFAHPGRQKSIHMNEKPVAMLRHFFRMTCDEYSRVLDPTAGSANALKAASGLGAPTVLGLERDPQFFQLATEAYFNEPLLDL